MSRTASPLHVLHVDDEPGFAEMAAEFLERHDDRLEITPATSVEEAFDALAEGHIDCIVSDYDMPGMDGIQFLETVRADRPDLPFVLFTGKGSEKVASEAISKGATDYLQKETGTDQFVVLANRVANAAEQYTRRERVALQERQYQELFEKAPVMYIVTRLDGDEPVVEFCNQQFADKLGYDREAVVGQRVYEFYTADSERAAREGGLERALAAEFFREERHLLTSGGEAIPTEVQATPRYDADGNVVGVLTLFFDVSDQREREQELELYRTMVETVPDGVYALDADLRYLAVNEGMTELTGYDREEIVGSHLSLFHDEEGVEAAKAARRDLRESDAPGQTEVVVNRHYPAGDDPIPCEVRFRALPSENGFRGTAGVVRDISDRLARESELERKNQRLEQFASVVSHDLQNPLNVATGRVDLLNQEVESPHLDEIDRSLSRMETLIERLLDLARGEDAGELEPVDLAELVRSCWETVPTASADLVVDTGLTIRANPVRLKQLVENLFKNAVEHGGDTVTVTVATLEDGAGFAVGDDGPGIPTDARETVFDLGFSGTEGGTGLGLNIVETIAAGHDWTVTLTEAPNGGARFEFRGVEVEA